MQRRRFLKAASGGTLIGFLAGFVRPAFARAAPRRYLRPPGALAENEFLSRCIRCGKCAEVCPNRCIQFFDLSNGLRSSDTPFIAPREKSCILCMKCGDACPTGAIQPIEKKLQPILDHVKMGHAVVDEKLCLSFQGKTCGVCYRACPLPDIAIYTGMLEQPHVTDKCIGCGLCERSCIQMPQAIRIIPNPDGGGPVSGRTDSGRVAS